MFGSSKLENFFQRNVRIKHVAGRADESGGGHGDTVHGGANRRLDDIVWDEKVGVRFGRRIGRIGEPEGSGEGIRDGLGRDTDGIGQRLQGHCAAEPSDRGLVYRAKASEAVR